MTTAIDGNTITTLIAIGGPFAAVAGLGWWLSGRFRKIETAQRMQLAAHELKDQERHDENIDRFRSIEVDGAERYRLISVSLAKLGANGK